jgi:TonB family protein
LDHSGDTLLHREEWNLGRFIKGIRYEENHEIPYDKYEEQPSFQGGISQMTKYIISSIRYPREARKAKEQGRVFVGFIVDKQGKIKDVKIIKGISPSLDEEAKRVVSYMPDWEPAEQRGASVNVRFVLPIIFKL